MMRWYQRHVTWQVRGVMVLGLALFGGCGSDDPGIPIPELAPVTGVVTLDGQPLEGATITFEPADLSLDRRESRAVTDSNGKYELVYVDDVKGAVMGPLTVRINKMGENEQSVVPGRYNSKSELQADVKAGSNTFDFPLKTK